MKAMRSRELDARAAPPDDDDELLERLERPSHDRYELLFEALRRGHRRRRAARRTQSTPGSWRRAASGRSARRRGLFSDAGRRPSSGSSGPAPVQVGRHLRRRVRGRDALLLLRLRGRGGAASGRGRERGAAAPSVVILGSGPNRIGQGIEFDYCCVHAAMTVREIGPRRRDDQLQPRDGLDRLRHLGPALLRAADGRGRARGDRRRAARGRDRPVRRPDAAAARRRPARTRACRCSARRSSRSTSPRTGAASAGCSTSSELQAPPYATRTTRAERGARGGRRGRLPAAGAPLVRARRPGDGDLLLRDGLAAYLERTRRRRRAASTRCCSTASSRTRSSSTSTRSATARTCPRRRSCSTSRRPACTRATRPA